MARKARTTNTSKISKGETMSTHAVFSPSSAERFMTCPASVKRSEGITDTPSKYATEGTNAHTHASDVLLNKIAYDPEQFEGLGQYIDYCTDLMASAKVSGGNFWIEERVYLDDEKHGTPDFVAMVGDTLYVTDLKYGYEAVPAKENKQLLYYAAAAIKTHSLNPTAICLTIVQPRLPNFPISSWLADKEILNRFVSELDKAVIIAKSDNAPAKIGDHCKYCKAVPVCAERKQEVKRLFELECKNDLIEEDILWVLENKSRITDFIEKVEDLAKQQPPKGYKLAPGVQRRSWKKDAELPQQLLELMPISLAKADKIGIDLTPFVEIKEGAQRLVKKESSILSKE